MIKIENKKFYFVGVSPNKEVLYIISIYNYFNENLATRIYSINIKNLNNYQISREITINQYKNFFVLGSKNDNFYPSLNIFSYPNSIEIDLDLFEYLYNNNINKINNLSFKLEGKCIKENNLFGYVYSGIQIIENFNDTNIYLVDSNNKKVADYFLPRNKKIKLLIPKNDIYSPFICKIKYACVVTEPEFSEYNKFPIKINYNGGNEKEEK